MKSSQPQNTATDMTEDVVEIKESQNVLTTENIYD
jgi:hypothetical protein